MKKPNANKLFIALLTIILLAALAVFASAEEPTIVDSGTCGDGSVAWKLDSEGTLTVSGNGVIYGDLMAGPFCEKSLIKRAVIESGVTDLGAYTFSDCENLIEVSIPNGITEIDNGVFQRCSSLKNVSIPSTVKHIRESVFLGCSSLTSIVLPEGVEDIGYASFNWCNNLTSIYLPASMTFIASESFEGCDSLTDVYYAGSKTQWNQIYFGDDGRHNEDLLNANIHYGSEDSAQGLNLFQRIIEWFRSLFDRLFGWLKR